MKRRIGDEESQRSKEVEDSDEKRGEWKGNTQIRDKGRNSGEKS